MIDISTLDQNVVDVITKHLCTLTGIMREIAEISLPGESITLNFGFGSMTIKC